MFVCPKRATCGCDHAGDLPTCPGMDLHLADTVFDYPEAYPQDMVDRAVAVLEHHGKRDGFRQGVWLTALLVVWSVIVLWMYSK